MSKIYPTTAGVNAVLIRCPQLGGAKTSWSMPTSGLMLTDDDVDINGSVTHKVRSHFVFDQEVNGERMEYVHKRQRLKTVSVRVQLWLSTHFNRLQKSCVLSYCIKNVNKAVTKSLSSKRNWPQK